MNWRSRGGYALTVAAVTLLLILPIGTAIAGWAMRLTWPEHLWLALATLPMIAMSAVLNARAVDSPARRGAAIGVAGALFLAPTVIMLTGKDWINGLFAALVIVVVAVVAQFVNRTPDARARTSSVSGEGPR